MMRTAQEIEAINALIPKAWKEAGEMVKKTGVAFEERAGSTREGNNGEIYNHCFRSQYFHEIMNRMTLERGLRG